MSGEEAPRWWPNGFADGHANRRAVLVLSSLRGLTPRRLLALAAREGSAAACLAAIRAGLAGSDGDRGYARRLDPEVLEAAVEACGARFVPAGSEEYPEGLRDLKDPPAALFVRGRSLRGFEPGVAIVGARNCTELGREMARSIGRGLGRSGVCVVSGAARGIDAASHEGALEVGGDTVAVLGCGIDRSYPPGSRSLIASIERSGALVSEYAPGVPAEPFRFPARNRIIAALGRALVVVEGAAGSGSLISADHALEIGRDVYAVPGAVNNPLAEVPLALIRDGAGLVRDAADLLISLHLSEIGAPPGASRIADATAAEQAALEHLTGPVLPERVAREMGVSLPEAISLLIGLEMKGLVRSVGGRFERRLIGA